MAQKNPKSWLYILNGLLNGFEYIDSMAVTVVMQRNFWQVICIWYVLIVKEIDETRVIKYLLLAGRIADIGRTAFPRKHVLVRKLLVWAFFALRQRLVSRVMQSNLQRLLRIWFNNNIHGHEWSQHMISAYNGIFPNNLGVPDMLLDFGAYSTMIGMENGISTLKVIEHEIGYKLQETPPPMSPRYQDNYFHNSSTSERSNRHTLESAPENEFQIDDDIYFKFELTTGRVCSLLDLDYDVLFVVQDESNSFPTSPSSSTSDSSSDQTSSSYDSTSISTEHSYSYSCWDSVEEHDLPNAYDAEAETSAELELDAADYSPTSNRSTNCKSIRERHKSWNDNDGDGDKENENDCKSGNKNDFEFEFFNNDTNASMTSASTPFHSEKESSPIFMSRNAKPDMPLIPVSPPPSPTPRPTPTPAPLPTSLSLPSLSPEPVVSTSVTSELFKILKCVPQSTTMHMDTDMDVDVDSVDRVPNYFEAGTVTASVSEGSAFVPITTSMSRQPATQSVQSVSVKGFKSRGKDMKTVMAAYAKSPLSNAEFTDDDEEEETAKRPRLDSSTTSGKDMKVLLRYLYEET